MEITRNTSKINDSYLRGLVCTLGLTVSSFGIVLAMENELGDFHALHFGWNNAEKKTKITYLTSAGVVGIMMGSFLANLSVEKGRRRTIIISQGIAIIGSLM